MAEALTRQQQYEADVEQAHQAEAKVREVLGETKAAAWRLAEALYAFDEAVGWRRLGHESLEEWLAQPEIGITKTTYYDLVGAWRKFVIHRGVEGERLKVLDPSKVAIVANSVEKSKATVEEALSDAEALGYRDLRAKYAKAKPPEAGLPQGGETEDAQPDEVVAGEGNLTADLQSEEPESVRTETATSSHATPVPELASLRAMREEAESLPWDDLETWQALSIAQASHAGVVGAIRKAAGRMLEWRSKHLS
jgi:hypothetical protein